ncbi:hypothetical protein D3C72_1852910 [compost metagenome]
MAIEEQDPVESVPHQRAGPVADGGDKGGRAQRNGPGEAEMMLGHADIEGWRNQDIGGLLGFARDDLRAQPVGAEQSGRTMLLVRADRDDDGAAARQELLDFSPG